jgi:hypothetical protein
MSIAAFVDVPSEKQDLAVELAIAMAEFSIEENEPLYLLVDAATALEVGMSLIGLRESRTVERGEYRASPIVLLPLIPRPNSPEDEVFRRPSEFDVGGDIAELYELGLFARQGEGAAEWDLGDEPASALMEVIARARPTHIVGLGETSTFWAAINEEIERTGEEYVPQLVMIDGFGTETNVGKSEQTFVHFPDLNVVRRPESKFEREVDSLEELRLKAERDGTLVAGFLDYLVHQSRRDG